MSGAYNVFSTRYEESRKRRSSDRVLAKKIWSYAKGYRRNLLVGTSAIVTGALTGLVSPYLHAIAIDQIITPKNFSGFYWWVPIFVFTTILNFYAQYIQVFQMRIVGEHTVEKLRDEIVAKIEVISLKYFSEGETGRIMSRLVNDANQLRIFLRQGLTQLLVDITSILGSLIVVFAINAKLAAIAVSILPFAIAAGWFLGDYSRRAYRRSLSELGGLTAKIQEDLSGMKVIKAFVREERAAVDFGRRQDQTIKAQIDAVKISTLYQPAVFFMRIIGTALILWYGSLMVKTGEITLGVLVAFTEYQFSYFMPLMDLTTAYDQYQVAMAGLERMFDLIETKVEVEDPLPREAVDPGEIRSVAFDKVTFGYDPSNPVIHDISFSLERNKKLALVGPTGAGKSTIINLVERFYNPLSGRITVNGYDVDKIRISSIREQTSTVLQDSFLFPISVRDNIRFGKPEASDEEVIEAAKAVGAHAFIMNLPGDYNHIIQEGSSNISIGQRQLISFARTLLMNPRLLILDEATSSIDPYTELVIQNALKKLLENRLAIIIAHRLSTIRLCNEIIVIDQGRIVERGSHAELMRKGGLYSSFYRMQFREEKGIEAPEARVVLVRALSSVILLRNEWEAFVSAVRQLAQIHEKLRTQISEQKTSIQRVMQDMGSRLGRRSSVRAAPGFVDFRQDPVATRAPVPRRFCLHCGADLGPADRFCRICGRST
jgi:ABC-type multidrug transport system fused ATPase/permease subunit